MKHTLLALMSFAVALSATAQTVAETSRKQDRNEKKVSVVKTTHDSELKTILEKDRPKENKAIPAPNFALRTADNKFVLTIGGQINPIIGVDLGNDLYEQSGAGINFVTSQIPVPAVSGKKSDFFINPLNAAVDLQVVGLGGTADQITSYIKFATSGNDTGISLNKAYVTWRGFTAGLKSTLFQDQLACQPPTIDPEGPCGMVSASSYEVSYVSPSYKGFRAAIGLDIPTYYTSNGRYYGHDFQKWNNQTLQGLEVCDPTYTNQNVPDVPMWVEWAANSTNRVRLSGIFRTLSYRDLLENKTRRSVGWGVMLSGNYSPVDPLIFYVQAVYGKGIGNYIQDIAGHPYSFTPKSDNPGEMTPNPMMGLNFGLTYNINSKWQVNAMASEARIWDVGEYANRGTELNNYKYAVYAAGNVFYNINNYLQVGLEYLYGHRQTWNIGGAANHRIQTQFMFTF